MADLISVIVPVYNTAQVLPRCLDSIMAQSYRNIEILAVDDGSVDNTAEVVKSFANIEGVKTTQANTINVYDVLNCNTIVFAKGAVEKIEEVYA